MIKVSVILTTYNSEEVVERAIKSFQNQTGLNEKFELEIIVVDDCSKDKTPEIVRSLNVELLSTNYNSGGPNVGRNIGLKRSSGDYICIADHDDEWNKDKILSVLPYLDIVPIVSSGFEVYDTSTNRSEVRVKKNCKSFLKYQKNETFLTKLSKTKTGQQTYLGSIIFSCELKDILFEEHFGVVDYDWILNLFHEKSSIEVCKPLYKRYVDGQNLSLNENYRRIDFYYSLLFIEKFQEKYPKEYIQAYRRIHATRAKYYYLLGDMKKARFYFLKSELSIKNFLYYFTTFVGADFVKNRFKVFG